METDSHPMDVEDGRTSKDPRVRRAVNSIMSALVRSGGLLFSWALFAVIMATLMVDCLIWMFDRGLPDHEQLANYEPPIVSRIFSGQGELIDEFANERRLFSPVYEIPPLVKDAFISAEDKNFYSHKGYDPVGMAKAFVDAMRGERLRGASTITQQVMKNFLLAHDRTLERKVKELILAFRLEKVLGKDKILELYLNEIFLGRNSYGVTAAAQTYFNKSLDDLTIEEAAYLAALPKAPSRYHPVRSKVEAVARRNFVVTEMVENGFVTEEAGAAAKAADLRTVLGGEIESFRSSLPDRDYFTDEIRRQLSNSFGENEFFSGGLTIRATIDAELQKAAAAALREGLVKYDRERSRIWRGTGVRLEPEVLADETAWRSALAAANLPRDIDGWFTAVVLRLTAEGVIVGVEDHALEPDRAIGSNDVDWVRRKAIEGGRFVTVDGLSDMLDVGDIVYVTRPADNNPGWSLRQVPEVEGAFIAMDVNTGRVLAMQGGFSYQHSVFNRATQAQRQPGSAFKPFVYAAAMDQGYTPATVIIDAPIEFETPEGLWEPKNAGSDYLGSVPVRKGLELSRNLMTIRLAEDVGMGLVGEYAADFGVYQSLAPELANALGAKETTLFKMASGYAMFANGGERVRPTLVDRVQDRWGKTVYRHDDRICFDCTEPLLMQGTVPQVLSYRTRVIDAITAYQIASMLQGVVDRGTASRVVNLGVPVAGKTGTTNDSKDAWFIGFTPDIVAGCYIGFDEPRSLGRRAYGSNLCGPVFNSFMNTVVKRYGSANFSVPPGGTFVDINRSSGERMDRRTAAANPELVVREYFRFGTEPTIGEHRIPISGGFVMGSDLEVYVPPAEGDDGALQTADGSAESGIGEAETTDGGLIQGEQSSFGAISSGGLY